jgi:LysR family glycine cleavage system transcriptional activator
MRSRLLPTLGELLAFESAGRHGNFTRAAAELNLTQSAVSRQIRMLEDQIGVPLFERVRQRVVLTAAGRTYLAEVQRILGSLRDATRNAMAHADEEATLNIAVLPTFGAKWLAPRMAAFAALHPRITVNFASRLRPFDFGNERFDAAVHFGAPTWPNATVRHLMDEYIVPVASSAFRQAHEIRTPADLARTPLLHLGTRLTAWLDWFALAEVNAPQGARGPVYDQFAMLLQAAASGGGAALAPRFLAEDDLASGRLEILFEQPLKSDGAYYLVTPEAGGGGTALRRFSDWLIATAREVQATP